jgi:hypothetical protein
MRYPKALPKKAPASLHSPGAFFFSTPPLILAGGAAIRDFHVLMQLDGKLYVANPAIHTHQYGPGGDFDVPTTRSATPADIYKAFDALQTELVDAMALTQTKQQADECEEIFEVAAKRGAAIEAKRLEGELSFEDGYFLNTLIAAIANAAFQNRAAVTDMKIIGASPEDLLVWETRYPDMLRDAFDQMYRIELESPDGSFQEMQAWKDLDADFRRWASYLWQVRTRLGLNIFGEIPGLEAY